MEDLPVTVIPNGKYFVSYSAMQPINIYRTSGVGRIL